MAISKELQKKVDFAIKLIQSASEMASKVGQPIEVAFSGGKDSAVILELTKMANVPYRAIYKNTTIDPPGTIKYCKDNGTEIVKPTKSFLEIIKGIGFPSRFKRFCCKELKERKTLDYVILGIRADESSKRKKRYKEPTRCLKISSKEKIKQYFPILNWNLQDMQEFIVERDIKLHPLYYDGNGNLDLSQRLGCLCCPLMSIRKRILQFQKYPNMLKLYARGGQYFLDNHPHGAIAKRFKNVYNWLCASIFCRNMVEFEQKFGKNLFNDGVDCKKFLEDYFNIKFD